MIALAGAFIYAELSSQSAASGGQYVYLRDALHPSFGFLYGWSLLFVIQTGGMAAVALIFANHLFELAGIRASELGVGNPRLGRAGPADNHQLPWCARGQHHAERLHDFEVGGDRGAGSLWSHPDCRQQRRRYAGRQRQLVQHLGTTLIAFGAALIPAQFAYGGWQTACFVAGEVREPREESAARICCSAS